jgi:hypothetical protein
MSNPFRKKTHELTEIERMKDRARQIKNMENQVKDLKQELAITRKRMNDMVDTAQNYEWLRQQELMLMTTDGVKYLKGEDLDEYIKNNRPPLQQSWLDHMAIKMQQAIDTGALRALVDEAHVTDAFTYTTNGRMIYGTDRTDDDGERRARLSAQRNA